jgi:hypothetical protein
VAAQQFKTVNVKTERRNDFMRPTGCALQLFYQTYRLCSAVILSDLQAVQLFYETTGFR